MNELRKLFDWKNHPASVFHFVIPIAGLAIFFMLAAGVAAIIEKGDWGHMIINVVGIVVGTVVLYRPIKMAMEIHEANEKRRKEAENEHH